MTVSYILQDIAIDYKNFYLRFLLPGLVKDKSVCVCVCGVGVGGLFELGDCSHKNNPISYNTSC